MSNPSSRRGMTAGDAIRIPNGETIATYDSYRRAQAAVDVLAKAEFPVKKVSIVGDGLTSIERVTGAMSYARSAGAGALTGAWFGLFVALLLLIFNPESELGLMGAAILIGAGFGMLFGLVSYSLNRRKRDFTSIMQVIATSYSLVVDPSVSNKARKLLSENPPTAH